jgi:hypothetical protein
MLSSLFSSSLPSWCSFHNLHVDYKGFNKRPSDVSPNIALILKPWPGKRGLTTARHGWWVLLGTKDAQAPNDLPLVEEIAQSQGWGCRSSSFGGNWLLNPFLSSPFGLQETK